MKVYLDNDVVSAIVKDDNAPESAALDRVLAAYGDGEVDLVTSTVTLKEIERYQGPQRPAIKQIFRLLKEVPRACIPMNRNDPLYDDLLKRGLEDIDAWHVFVAAKNGRTPFLRATGLSTTTLLPLGSYVAWSCRSLPTSLQVRGGAAGLLSSHERAFGLFAQQIAVPSPASHALERCGPHRRRTLGAVCCASTVCPATIRFSSSAKRPSNTGSRRATPARSNQA
jgi:hypothetical protein